VKKKEVEIGGLYTAKVSGKIATVRLVRESPYGGWDAINIDTNREVRIKTAARLRRAVTQPVVRKPVDKSLSEDYVPTPQQVAEAVRVLKPGTRISAMLLLRGDSTVYGARYLIPRDNAVLNISGIIAGITGAAYNSTYNFVRVDAIHAAKLIHRTSLALFSADDVLTVEVI
jgi:hypothetical protein